MSISTEEIIDIFDDEFNYEWIVKDPIAAFLILQSFIGGSVIEGAGHDVIYSVDIETLTSLDRDQIILLRNSGFAIQDNEFLVYYV